MVTIHSNNYLIEYCRQPGIPYWMKSPVLIICPPHPPRGGIFLSPTYHRGQAPLIGFPSSHHLSLVPSITAAIYRCRHLSPVATYHCYHLSLGPGPNDRIYFSYGFMDYIQYICTIFFYRYEAGSSSDFSEGNSSNVDLSE